MNKQLKSILLISPGFSENEGDTTCIPALQEFVRGINQYYPQLEVTVISMHYPATSKTYQWYNNEVHSIGANNCKFPKRFMYWKKMKKCIERLHAQKSFDLVHTFWYDEVTYVASKVSKRLNIPLCCTFMGQDALGVNSYVKRIKIDHSNLIALSEFQQKKISEHLAIGVNTVIPWGVSNVIGEEEKKIDLINIGAFNDIKNQKEAITIIHEVVRVKPELKCVFVGAGPHLNSCKDLVKSLGLANSITFTGAVDRSEVFKILRQSKLMLHTSKYESFGMIFAEAICSGTMIVSKKVGIATKHDWWSIYESRTDAIQKTIKLLSNPSYPQEEDTKVYGLKSTVDHYIQFWHTKKGRT